MDDDHKTTDSDLLARLNALKKSTIDLQWCVSVLGSFHIMLATLMPP